MVAMPNGFLADLSFLRVIFCLIAKRLLCHQDF